MDGSIQYLVNSPMPRTNSDLGMGGWQSKYVLQSQADWRLSVHVSSSMNKPVNKKALRKVCAHARVVGCNFRTAAAG